MVGNDPVNISVVEVIVVKVPSRVKLLIIVPTLAGSKFQGFKVINDFEMVGRQRIFDVFDGWNTFEELESVHWRSFMLTNKVGAYR